MNASSHPEGRRSAPFSMVACAAAALVVTLAYVGVWQVVPPGFYLFLVLGTYALLGGLGLVQLFRATRMETWPQRLGALGVVVGLAATVFLGLRPRPACIEAGPCLSGLTVHPPQLALGIGLVAVSLFLDGR